MNKHYNKRTKQYRYKSYNSKTKEYNGVKYHTVKMGYKWSGYHNRVKYDYVNFDYKPYFIYRLLWYLRYINPIIKLDKPSKRHITIVGLMVATIIAMFIIAIVY